ncbi:MAG: FmdE family protein [Desulfonatronovibrionaceae bacterium]
MSGCTYSQKTIEDTISFHGHSCPGLATGIRAAELAVKEVGTAYDEEVVCITETDMCAVDAIQFLLGCTYGKGNLIHWDIGKNAFSFYNRETGHNLRILCQEIDFPGRDRLRALHKKGANGSLEAVETQELADLRHIYTQRIMQASLPALFQKGPVKRELPRKARILGSVTCFACGEPVMESRARMMGGEYLCLPCFREKEQKL